MKASPALGPDHQDTLSTMTNLAALYDYTKASVSARIPEYASMYGFFFNGLCTSRVEARMHQRRRVNTR